MIKINKKYLILFVFFFIPLSSQAQNLEIYFLDVHSGNACLIISPGPAREAMVVDLYTTGAATRMNNLLNSKGVTKLKYTIASHSDSDHTAGFVYLVGSAKKDVTNANFHNGHFADYPQSYRDAVLDTTAGTQAMRNNQIITLSGGVTVRCINVNGYVTGYGFSSATDDNGRSIGITVSYNSFSIWIGGDTTIRVENAIVASSLSSNELDMDVYLANHHGDNDGNQLDGDGNSQNFINRLKPEAAIISAGSQYDNPNANCVNYLIGVGAYIYQTCYDPGQYDIPPGNGIVFNQDGNSTGDYDGDIKIETDGSTYSVSGRITPAGIYVSNTYTAGGGIGSVSFTPSTLLNNGIDRVKVEAVISLDPSLISNVTMDWSSLGGTNTETLYDDGTHGDSISNDSIYTFTNIYSTSNEGTYPVGITVVKKDASTVVKTVNLTLVEDRFAPFAEDFYLKLTNSGIRLSWINPVEEDFDYLMVRYDTGPASFPETINEGTFLYKQTNNSASEYFHSPIQFYKKYFYTIFFIDVKGNTTKLQRSILVTPTDEKDFARISDNLIKPEDEQQVEIVFHDSVISTFPEISVYNALGDQVRDMKVDPSSLDASNNSVRWDLTDSNGQKVGSGLYYIVISTSKGQLKYKVLVVR